MDIEKEKIFISPCGLYCIACTEYKDNSSCRGCRSDTRHNKCDIYECCVILGGKEFCYECDCFPCERLHEFSCYNPGKSFAHFRHVAIDNLKQMKESGVEQWAEEIKQQTLSGNYSIMKKNSDGTPDLSPCSCNTCEQE